MKQEESFESLPIDIPSHPEFSRLKLFEKASGSIRLEEQ
jgi:hypothetical protein